MWVLFWHEVECEKKFFFGQMTTFKKSSGRHIKSNPNNFCLLVSYSPDFELHFETVYSALISKNKVVYASLWCKGDFPGQEMEDWVYTHKKDITDLSDCDFEYHDIILPSYKKGFIKYVDKIKRFRKYHPTVENLLKPG